LGKKKDPNVALSKKNPPAKGSITEQEGSNQEVPCRKHILYWVYGSVQEAKKWGGGNKNLRDFQKTAVCEKKR